MKKDDFSGVDFYFYPPRWDTKRYSLENLRAFSKKFKLNEALCLIGKVSFSMFEKHEVYRLINNVPVQEHVLLYLSKCLIENSNDYRNRIMTPKDLAKACDMYLRLEDPIETDGNGTSFLVRMSTQQSDAQHEMRYLLPRTLLIYKELWQTVKESQKLNVSDKISEVSGLQIEELLAIGLGYSMKSVAGYLYPFRVPDSENEVMKRIFTKENQRKFLSWLSCDYNAFREYAKRKGINRPGYERFYFNPLVRYPMIKPDRNPVPDKESLFIVPVTRLIFERITRGLYFELSDHFQGSDGSNPFRTSFGYVFQEYIGWLIRNSIECAEIQREFSYRKGTKHTSDWLIIKDETCVLIEVKQSSIHLESRLLGQSSTLERDLAKTVARGVRQMWLFNSDVNRNLDPELRTLSGIEKVERLIITYDQVFFENSIIKDTVEDILLKDGVVLPDGFHYHIISVEEFEYVLESYGNDLYGFLLEKRSSPELYRKDFRVYFRYKNPNGEFKNKYLDKKFDEFVGVISEKEST
jgi:hypothetical protein